MRRYVYDFRGNHVDAADGKVVGWLPKEESDYQAEVRPIVSQVEVMSLLAYRL